MVIKDLLVHLDQTPVAQKRLDAALTLGQPLTRMSRRSISSPSLYCGGRLVTTCRTKSPANICATRSRSRYGIRRGPRGADSRGVVLETRLEAGGLDRLPIILARNARNADLVVVGEPDPENNGTDDALLVEAAFMETGRPALVVPYGGVRAMPPGRVIIAWDGSREAARAVMTPCRCCAGG